ncbi:MAG TPA: glycosyltransferase family protein [Vicinamibacterales bacterium]|nr:glycosyltransferase family protein [Vicinamibacterales bacterium]
MNRVAILQARSGSTRLPRKVLMELGGRPMLQRVIERLQRCARLDRIVVATTDLAEDDAVVEAAQAAGAGTFRGSEHDVLLRYAGAAHAAEAELIVRVTADCPLLDPTIVDRVVATLEDDPAGADYASNVIERTYPRGLDVEAFFADTLERVDRRARSRTAREHVTAFVLREQPQLFTLRSVRDVDDNSDLRWTVDESADLDMIRCLYRDLGLGSTPRPYLEVLQYVRAHPELAAMNAAIQQKLH